MDVLVVGRQAVLLLKAVEGDAVQVRLDSLQKLKEGVNVSGPSVITDACWNFAVCVYVKM